MLKKYVKRQLDNLSRDVKLLTKRAESMEKTTKKLRKIYHMFLKRDSDARAFHQF